MHTWLYLEARFKYDSSLFWNAFIHSTFCVCDDKAVWFGLYLTNIYLRYNLNLELLKMHVCSLNVAGRSQQTKLETITHIKLGPCFLVH